MAAMRNQLASDMAQPVAARDDAVTAQPGRPALSTTGPAPGAGTGGDVGNSDIVVADGSVSESESDGSGVGTDDEGTDPRRDGEGQCQGSAGPGRHPAGALPRGQKWRGKSPLFSKSIKDAPTPALDAELDFLESLSAGLGFAETKYSSPERKFPTEVRAVVLSPLGVWVRGGRGEGGLVYTKSRARTHVFPFAHD